MVALSAAAILKSYISRTPPFRASCLTALRCCFLSTRSAFAARLGRVGLRLRWSDMGSGNHFRQPRAAHRSRFASCVRKRRAVISSSPAPVTRLPAMRFSRS